MGKLNLCGHGAGAQFCKFARPGKPCTYGGQVMLPSFPDLFIKQNNRLTVWI